MLMMPKGVPGRLGNKRGQWQQMGFEHLEGHMEGEEGGLYDCKDFSLPGGSMIQCAVVRKQIYMVER